MNLFTIVKSKLSILTIIQEYCSLKKAGGYWKGSCPFHQERTASFTVSPHREIFYCFGCHQGGDVIAFIALIERCNQREAAQILIERYQLQISQELIPGTQLHEKARYEKLCELVAQWLHEALLDHKEALSYLRQRGISFATIERWKLGYFPHQNTKALVNFLNSNGFLFDEIVQAHITLEGKQGIYSPFEDRIIFPIQDYLGKVCAFGGRTLRSHDTRPKYYNSPENAYFTKGSLLFGLSQAKQTLKESNEAFLVEGYMDCLALHQEGFTQTVATLGTACTQEHILLLERYCGQVCVIYDADKAGKQALARLARQCWNNKLELSVALLPEKEDPASLLEKKLSLTYYLGQKKDILSFYLDHVSEGFFKKTTEEKLAILDTCLEAIGDVHDDLKRNLLLQKTSALYMISLDKLEHRLQGKARIPPPLEATPKKQFSLEKLLFSVILRDKIALSVEDEQFFESHVSASTLQLFRAMKAYAKDLGSFDLQHFITHCTESERTYIAELIMIGEDDISLSYDYLFGEFQKKQWKLLVNDVKMELAQPVHKQDQTVVREKLKALQNLQKKLQQRGLI